MPNSLRETIVTTTEADTNNHEPQLHQEHLDQVLHQLAHDLRSPLSVISMGIEAIRALKHDPSQLDTICDMMAKQGVESIKDQLAQLTRPHPPSA